MATWESAADRLSILTALGGEDAVFANGTFGTCNFGLDPFGGTMTVTGLLERDYVDVQGIESEMPVLTCRTTDVASVKHGDAVTVNSTSYVVRGVRNDGTGMTALALEEQ